MGGGTRGPDARRYDSSVLFFTPAIAPSGASFTRRCDTASVTICSSPHAGNQLRRVRFDPADARRVGGHEALIQGRYGRLRDVISGPDGALYVSTRNRDGRASVAPNDDRVLRIVAVQ